MTLEVDFVSSILKKTQKAKFLPVMSNPPYAMSKENELLLDVHVPIKGEKLPVMVYIHGGSYQIGGPGFESFILQF